MLLCVDVHYEERAATTAAVGFTSCSDSDSTLELVVRSECVPQPYEPGQFYKRELPHLLSVVDQVRQRQALEAVIIDGHVWLDDGRPGLGAHLHDALERRVAVIGVAKSAFHEGVALPIARGQSRQALFVTAAGMDPDRAAELVRSMHGQHRIPTLVKRADRLARGHERPDPTKAPGARS